MFNEKKPGVMFRKQINLRHRIEMPKNEYQIDQSQFEPHQQDIEYLWSEDN